MNERFRLRNCERYDVRIDEVPGNSPGGILVTFLPQEKSLGPETETSPVLNRQSISPAGEIPPHSGILLYLWNRLVLPS